MIRLRFIVILLLLIVGIQKSYSQNYTFQATGFSVLEKDEKNRWGKWSDLKKTELIIKLDTEKNRIIVYSQEIQLYKIVKYEERIENDEDITYPFTCQDDDGQTFIVSIITRKKQNNRKQMYINQRNVIIVYNIISADLKLP